MSSCARRASRCSSCTSSTSSSTRTAIGTRSSASSTASGSSVAVRRCGRRTSPATSSSSTTRARSRASSTRRPARSSRSSSSSRCSARATTRTPRRRARSASHDFIGSARARAVLLRRCAARRSCPISSRAACACLPLRARRSSARTKSWRSTTARRCCRRAQAGHATKRRSKSACWSRSAGSWRGCAIKPSSRSRRSTSASPSSSSSSTTGRCGCTARAVASSSSARARGARPAAGGALRVQRVEEGARQHRLPRRSRSALLLGAAPFAARKAGCALTATTVEIFLRGERIASHARSYVRGAHDEAGAHAGVASEARAVDAVAAHRVGPDHRRSPRRSCSSASSRRASIPSTATARASASCGSRSATAPRVSKRRALARCASTRARTSTSSPRSSTGSIDHRCTTTGPRPRACLTRTCAARLLQLKETRC